MVTPNEPRSQGVQRHEHEGCLGGMMRHTCRGSAAVVLLALAGCGGAAPDRDVVREEGRPQVLIVPLQAVGANVGRIGQAMLTAYPEETSVTLHLSGVPPYVSRPVHLYTYIRAGACGASHARDVHALTGRVLASPVARPGAMAAYRGPVTLTNVAPVPLEKLLDTQHAIDVRTHPADGNQSIFCGTIAR